MLKLLPTTDEESNGCAAHLARTLTGYGPQGCGGKFKSMPSLPQSPSIAYQRTTSAHAPSTLGIDVGKNMLACTLVDGKSRIKIWREEVKNDPIHIEKLLQKTSADTYWVVEPTGRYSHDVVKLAQSAGRTVLMAPPRKAKAFLQSIQSRAKTDRIDSQGLALFAMSVPLAPYRLKSEAVEHVQQLLSARKNLSKSLMSLKLQATELPYAKEDLQSAIDSLTESLKAFDKKIAKLSREEPELALVKELLKVPGIGPVIAPAIAATLISKNFTHPDQFVAYLGLDINIRQSGQRQGQLGLTKQGNAELRRLLYVGAQSNLRCKSSVFKDQYQRERAKGLKSTGALCAVSRKMAHVCWALHHRGGSFDPARVYRPNPGRRAAETEAVTVTLPEYSL